MFMPWSHSKVDLAEKCPKAFRLRYVDRAGRKEGTDARVGTAVHSYVEERLDGATDAEAAATAQTKVSSMTTTEIETAKERHVQAEAYVQRVESFRTGGHVVHEGREVQLAIRADGTPCAYEDPDALMRGSVDHLIEQTDRRALIIDHKAGRPHPIAHYRKQLSTYKVLTVVNRPHLIGVRAGIHHIQKSDILWEPVDLKRQVERVHLPWLIRRIEEAAAGLEGYPAKVSKLCGWCDHHERCEEGLAFTPPRKTVPGTGQKRTVAPRKPRAPREEPRPEPFESVGDLFGGEDVIL